MGEPAVAVKEESEDVSLGKKKLEQKEAEEGAPDAKKMKVEPEDVSLGKKKLEQAEAEEGAPDAKKVKVDPEANGVSKKENGASQGEVQQTAEERGDPNLEAEIVSQIEYYFGDVNLPKDKFLQEQIKLDDGWIPIEVMLRFQRLNSLSKKADTIVSCLKKSSKLMEVSEDGSKMRRSPSKPLPERNEEWQKKVNERTVYCKGFPQDQDFVGPYIEFFKQYGPVDHINLRKYLERGTKKFIFKGSAYVLFETKELADKFLAVEKVEYNGKELTRLTFDAHNDEKKKERDERFGKKVKKTGPKEEEQSKPKREFAKACVLKLVNITNEELTREDIKSTITEMGAEVSFIDFSKGDKEALVRLKSTEDGAATEILQKLEGNKVKIGEEELDVSVLEGEEESTYFDKVRESLDKFHKPKGRKGFHRGGGKGFRGHNRRGRSPPARM